MATDTDKHAATRRRALFAGAAGIAGAAVAAGAPAQAATAVASDTSTLDWYNVKLLGAVGDGQTDDTSAIQAALNSAAATGGTVYFPEGTYRITPAARTTSLSGASAVGLTVPSNVNLRGSNQYASTLVKHSAGTLLAVSGSGPSPDTGSSTHTQYCTISDLGLSGGNNTGLLLEMYYCDVITVRDVLMQNNNGICVDLAECWDSRFYNVVIGGCTGTAGSTTQPAMWIRCSAAASGTWGYSGDTSNQIHLLGCRFEAFGTGALAIGHGPGSSSGVNSIYLTDCKFESSSIQSAQPFLSVDSSSRAVHATNIYCYANNFANTAPAGTNPPSMISWQPQASSLSNVLIANGSTTASIASGVIVYAAANDTAVLRNVVGNYALAPTGAHIWQASSPGAFSFDNCYANSLAVAFNGTAPTVFAPGAAVPQINGTVSDASFATTPANGTMAVNTAAKTLCVRVNGTWLSTPLS